MPVNSCNCFIKYALYSLKLTGDAETTVYLLREVSPKVSTFVRNLKRKDL